MFGAGRTVPTVAAALALISVIAGGLARSRRTDRHRVQRASQQAE
ncbi:DUF6223 family protein [Actinosynnema sp. ALI-1.44]|nr:DUF6223 family protein [Actinosynnema sp. ALI-1.44]